MKSKKPGRKEGKAKYEINDGSNSSLPCLLVIPTLNSPFKDILRQSACGNPGVKGLIQREIETLVVVLTSMNIQQNSYVAETL